MANMQLSSTTASRGLRCTMATFGAPQPHHGGPHHDSIVFRQPRRVMAPCTAQRRGFRGYSGADMSSFFQNLSEVTRAFDQMAQDYETQYRRRGQRWPSPGDTPVDAEARDVPPGPCMGVPVDIEERSDGYDLWLDVPGLAKSDVKIQVFPEQRRITISGERKRQSDASTTDAADGKDAPIRRRYERSMGRFSRTLPLAKDLDVDTLTARVEKGVLHVSARKLQQPPSNVVEVAID